MVLETERLILRPFTVDDFDAFAAMYADPMVHFLAVDGKPMSRFDAWRALAGIVGHWTLRGFGLFAIEERGAIGVLGPWLRDRSRETMHRVRVHATRSIAP